MKYLLDTNIFLWWLDGDKKLKKQIFSKIDDNKEMTCVSVASFWEIVIKVNKKKLPLKFSVNRILKKFDFNILDVNLKHILEIKKLPNYHQDPFDRLLVAQAIAENLELLTSDDKIEKYF